MRLFYEVGGGREKKRKNTLYLVPTRNTNILALYKVTVSLLINGEQELNFNYSLQYS